MSEESKTLMDAVMDVWRESLMPTINQALDLAPVDKLDWAPAKDMMSLGNIFLHISETSDWWYGEVMKGNESKELTTGSLPPKSEIAERMNTHSARMERFFAEPTEALVRIYDLQRRDRVFTYSGYWILTHLLEHDIHHRSQINQYLRILGITPP